MRDSATIVDWYTLNETTLYQFASFPAMNASVLESMRRIGGYIPRIFVVPDPSQYPIEFGSAFLYDVQMKIGSLIYGLLFYCQDITDFYLQVRQQDGVMMFSEPANALLLVGDGTVGPPVYLVSCPFVVGNDGKVAVEIYNGNSTINATLSPQLLLLVAEPCDDLVKECTSFVEIEGLEA